MRQSLYEFSDAKNSLPKAKRASEKLKEIYPGVVSEGYSLEIPMPGHSITSTETISKTSYDTIENLIKQHDAVFLLTDSRVSR